MPEGKAEIDTTNRYLVGVQRDLICLRALAGAPSLPRDRALNLAAWIVALADPTGAEFPKVLKAVLED